MKDLLKNSAKQGNHLPPLLETSETNLSPLSIAPREQVRCMAQGAVVPCCNNIDNEDDYMHHEEDINENQGTPRQGITIIEDTGCSSSKSYFIGIPLLLFGYIRRRKK